MKLSENDKDFAYKNYFGSDFNLDIEDIARHLGFDEDNPLDYEPLRAYLYTEWRKKHPRGQAPWQLLPNTEC
jgi:hypothetical protein